MSDVSLTLDMGLRWLAIAVLTWLAVWLIE